jgi:hypothetical protein
VLILASVSCSKTVDRAAEKIPATNEYHEYIIPKGEHYAAGNNLGLVDKKSLVFKVRFDSSCIYTLNNVANATDINKLYGFSDCGTNHQENSTRYGWLWNGKAIELHAYCYADGKRSSKLLTTVGIGQEIELAMGIEPGKYVFTVKGKKEYMQRSCTDDEAQAYQLFPYFGGDEVAPHDVHIFIKQLMKSSTAM